MQITALDLKALRTLSVGGDIGGGRFNRLCDLGLTEYRGKTTVSGTKMTRDERAWITAKGKAALANLNAEAGR